MKILVTGGCGFIGSAFLNLMVPRHKENEFVNLDALTYAANPMNLAGLEETGRYSFIKADISDEMQVRGVFQIEKPDWVVHFAAESHVDRSILGPKAFVQTNVVGTMNLLEACREIWGENEGHLFHHVSTDEVYGELGDEGLFTETTPYSPSSPYSASKASSDHLVRAWNRTFGLPVKITNCSNNYGPRQFPEKLIPIMILNAAEGRPLPVYGDGSNVRDWLHVDDHCEAIWQVMTSGKMGETYNIGGDAERTNIQVVEAICKAVATETGTDLDSKRDLITHVTDRPGHDFRYAIDTAKIKSELGWQPAHTFEQGLSETVAWYLNNSDWVETVRSGEYRNWIDQNYGARS
jgi:dTDP-glucose 4,6-dehydratase